MVKWPPIPNTCKRNQLEKCLHGIETCAVCPNLKTCKDFEPIYSWREVSDYYTCPKCFDPCTYMGCPKCDPEGYKEATDYATSPTHNIAIFIGNKKVETIEKSIQDRY